jgi:nucleoside-diphosphate-sugar epimerase
MHNIDVVYHLAGLTKSLHADELLQINQGGTRNVAMVCSEMERPPVLVIASSLAAAGPAPAGRPRTEIDPLEPVSAYGNSKRAGELAAREFAAQVPITIVRPPVVFGEGDKDSFNLFQGISRLGIHLVPGLRDYQFSAIHACDLAVALTLAAERGERMVAGQDVSGTYFAADSQSVSYGEFGRMIGRCLGRPHAWVVRAPGAAVWTLSAINEFISKLRGRPHILNLDKAREATAGPWACSPALLRHDTGFHCERTLEERINQTVDWYVSQGWLQRKHRAS